MREFQDQDEVLTDSYCRDYGHGFMLNWKEQMLADRAATQAEVDEAMIQQHMEFMRQIDSPENALAVARKLRWSPEDDNSLLGGFCRGEA